MLAIGIVFCCFQACKKGDEISITSKEAIIAEYQKQMLLQQHDTLTIREYIYLDKWHDAKVITKHTIDSILIASPDTCHTYIKSIEKVYHNERNAANLVHASDSMIIQNLNAIVKVDSLLISKAKQDLKLTRDSLKPKPLKKFINNAKHVISGVLVGAAIVEVINILKP
jgi:hypothetical protein